MKLPISLNELVQILELVCLAHCSQSIGHTRDVFIGAPSCTQSRDLYLKQLPCLDQVVNSHELG